MSNHVHVVLSVAPPTAFHWPRAQEHGLKLATRNASDFDWIPALTVDSLGQFAA